MLQALNGTAPRPHPETVSRKQLTKLVAQVGSRFCVGDFYVQLMSGCINGLNILRMLLKQHLEGCSTYRDPKSRIALLSMSTAHQQLTGLAQ